VARRIQKALPALILTVLSFSFLTLAQAQLDLKGTASITGTVLD